MKYFTEENISLKKYNTLGIGNIAKYLYEPTSFNDLKDALKYYKDNNIKYFVVGNGSNIIFPDNDFDGVLITLKKLNNITINNNVLEVEGGVLLPHLNKHLLDKGYTNFIWAAGIPGTVGGAIYGNAGAYNFDTFHYLKNVTILKDNEMLTLNKDDIKYGYRETNLTNTIILKGSFELLKDNLEESINIMNENLEKRKLSQPLEYKNAGSTFRNPVDNYAGKLIEDSNLKGKTINDAMVSTKHANFIVNLEKATSKDITDLIYIIKKEVKQNYNIDLVLENKIIKWEEL